MERVEQIYQAIKQKVLDLEVDPTQPVDERALVRDTGGSLTLVREALQRLVKDGIVDHLVIDQNSSKCPSMWHDLWPMHRGHGYQQNYLDGFNMKSLEEDLSDTYQPVFHGQAAQLFVARQWHKRSETRERTLLRQPGVGGLVFSSFRHDNPGPVSRNRWYA